MAPGDYLESYTQDQDAALYADMQEKQRRVQEAAALRKQMVEQSLTEKETSPAKSIAGLIAAAIPALLGGFSGDPVKGAVGAQAGATALDTFSTMERAGRAEKQADANTKIALENENVKTAQTDLDQVEKLFATNQGENRRRLAEFKDKQESRELDRAANFENQKSLRELGASLVAANKQEKGTGTPLSKAESEALSKRNEALKEIYDQQGFVTDVQADRVSKFVDRERKGDVADSRLELQKTETERRGEKQKRDFGKAEVRSSLLEWKDDITPDATIARKAEKFAGTYENIQKSNAKVRDILEQFNGEPLVAGANEPEKQRAIADLRQALNNIVTAVKSPELRNGGAAFTDLEAKLSNIVPGFQASSIEGATQALFDKITGRGGNIQTLDAAKAIIDQTFVTGMDNQGFRFTPSAIRAYGLPELPGTKDSGAKGGSAAGTQPSAAPVLFKTPQDRDAAKEQLKQKILAQKMKTLQAPQVAQ